MKSIHLIKVKVRKTSNTQQNNSVRQQMLCLKEKLTFFFNNKKMNRTRTYCRSSSCRVTRGPGNISQMSFMADMIVRCSRFLYTRFLEARFLDKRFLEARFIDPRHQIDLSVAGMKVSLPDSHLRNHCCPYIALWIQS